jgi:hypothetical protein
MEYYMTYESLYLSSSGYLPLKEYREFLQFDR